MLGTIWLFRITTYPESPRLEGSDDGLGSGQRSARGHGGVRRAVSGYVERTDFAESSCPVMGYICTMHAVAEPGRVGLYMARLSVVSRQVERCELTRRELNMRGGVRTSDREAVTDLP